VVNVYVYNNVISMSAESEPDVRPQFGNRLLSDSSAVFTHNAWDHVEWDDEQKQLAAEKVATNSTTKMDAEVAQGYDRDANKYWDAFYGIHNNRFFKDRAWLFTEFAELKGGKNASESESKSAKSSEDLSETMNNLTVEDFPGCSAKNRILEVGCGVGNTIFPIVEMNFNNDTFVYGCDFSEKAVSLVKEDSKYDPTKIHAFQWDVTEDSTEIPFPKYSLDIVILIFALSAIHPDKMKDAISRICSYLKPGGLLLFRDYGRHDLAQLRFKPGKCVTDHFYVRGDGTSAYFFTEEECHQLFSSIGLAKEQLVVDRRLQVNRGKQLKMFRVWIQCKYRKPTA